MNRKTIFGILLLTAVVLVGLPEALALPSYVTPLQSLYGSGLSCGTCHTDPAGGGPRNAYGLSFQAVPTHSTDPAGALCSIGTPAGATTNTCPTPTATPTPTPTATPTPTPTATPTPTPTAASPFNISGFKINNATGSGISGWNITLRNSTMQTSMLTGSDGSYMFTSLANGTYNVTEETRSGFTNVTPTMVQVTIAGSDAVNINFTNAPIISPQPTKAKVTFVVTDNATGKPIKGAVVSLLGVDIKTHIRERVIHLHRLMIRTNDTGIAVFPNVPPGNYKYRVSKDDYRTASGNVNVTGDIRVPVKLVAESEEGDD